MHLEQDKELQEKIEQLRKKTEELKEARMALMNMLQDVEAARSELERERNKTSAVIANLTDGLLIFDNDNKLVLINPKAEDFFEVEASEVIGKSISGLERLASFKPLIELLERDNREVFRQELAIKNDLTLEVSTTQLPRRLDEDQETLDLLVILHDVTRDKLVEKMKSEFVSLAAHQLRTPLSAIKWTLRVILDQELGEINKEQRDFLERIYQSNERMINLINDLLNITRIEEGRYLQKPILIGLESIVNSAMDIGREEALRKKIRFTFLKPQSPLPRVSVDVEKIQLVAQNLIDNALRYTPPGGEVTISLVYDKDKKEIEFLIKDSGIGIPKDQSPRVFSKFFRASNALKKDTEGTGLGLFIAKNIIDAHGGRIWFESEEGRGSIFHFILPISPKQS